MNPPTTTASSIPDDIRLKCSYYASEIKTQVNSLFKEQHKWLDNHLNEIKETLDKVTEMKAGTRAVMAGIIKTPSRKRTKRISKKISESDHVGLDASGNLSSVLPLSELKRSHLNMNSQEVQDIINQQLEKERKEIESRLQKELSLLDQQYKSPVKKRASSSTLISTNWSFQSYWCPQNPNLTETASFDGRIAINSLQSTGEESNAAPPPLNSGPAVDVVTISNPSPPNLAQQAPTDNPSTKLSPVVNIKQVVTKSTLVERALKLENASQARNLQNLCKERVNQLPSTASTIELQNWKLLSTRFKTDSSDELVNLLGFSRSKVKLMVKRQIEN
ncbi:hypothetical protein PCANC_16025 [Puccinia coronata f. sp. avenae]|uniref:Uncharacterized protein n=1 Tax=Puccinia coronata f. sp. avenae TaxID=200324 RepID=A0A2N5UM10_9BASI|nr:hypothetical protein PCANC_16025 [Puccinia coronata f. sp. avenae]